MIKHYIELSTAFEPLVYTVGKPKEILYIRSSKIQVDRKSDSDILVKFDWETGFKKGVKMSITDLEALMNIYKIILNEEPSWKAGRSRLVEAKEVDDI